MVVTYGIFAELQIRMCYNDSVTEYLILHNFCLACDWQKRDIFAAFPVLLAAAMA